jgi:hypothetical protein
MSWFAGSRETRNSASHIQTGPALFSKWHHRPNQAAAVGVAEVEVLMAREAVAELPVMAAAESSTPRQFVLGHSYTPLGCLPAIKPCRKSHWPQFKLSAN